MKEGNKALRWGIVRDSISSIIMILLFVAAFLFYKCRLAPSMSAETAQGLGKYVATVCVLWMTYIIQKIVVTVLRWYGRNVSGKTKSELDDKFIPLIERTVRVVIWTISIIIILPFYGVQISALITTLGVGSLAIALAAQDTIANIISGFLIMVDVPFQEGDRIKLPSGEIAVVLDIGIRRSRFVSLDKKTVYIVPNLDLSKSKIENYTYAEKLANPAAS